MLRYIKMLYDTMFYTLLISAFSLSTYLIIGSIIFVLAGLGDSLGEWVYNITHKD